MAALVTIPAVPIAKVGVWQAATGEWTCTAAQLRSAVAAEESGLFRTPILKIGHDDPRFTDGETLGDGEPAVGRLERLRLEDDGQTLVADLVGVPAWLAEILASAYPSRSIEAALDVPTGDIVWPMVVTGLALLGVQAPAIESLGDIADLYGASRQVEDYVAAARARMAAAALPEGDQMPRSTIGGRPLAASASIDELCAAAEEWALTQPQLGRDCWVRDIYTDSVIFSCWCDDECQLWRATWAESGDGIFTFGSPEQVRQTYVPVPASSQEGEVAAMAASHARALALRASQRVAAREPQVAVPSPRGRDVTAGAHPSGEHVPLSPAVAEALGVPVDADDEAVLAAIAQRPPAATEPTAPTTQEGGTVDAPPPADVEQLVTAAVARATAPILATLESTTTELSALKAERVTAARDRVIGDAITAGKIKPADRQAWEADYDGNPAVITSVLARIAPGTAVPVTAAGRTGGEQTGTAADDEALYAQLYGAEKAGV